MVSSIFKFFNRSCICFCILSRFVLGDQEDLEVDVEQFDRWFPSFLSPPYQSVSLTEAEELVGLELVGVGWIMATRSHGYKFCGGHCGDYDHGLVRLE